ncbi:MAG: restriction endonuclease subunit S [Nanoarchaeota archaeon]|nr:restriction endonuclease subunit S [Nanoarchaeota archaeon]
MAVMSVVKLSESYRNKRLDPGFYKPEYLAVESTLIKKPNKRLLKQSEKINCGPFGSTLMCETYIANGVPIIRPFNLIGMKVEGEIVYIPKEDIEKKGLKLFNNGEICFSRVGDVKFGIIYGFKNSVTISPNIIAAKLHKGQLNPYFLVAFLNTKYGYKQLERGLKVVAQPTINTADIGKIIVPQFDYSFQNIIKQIILKAFNLYDLSKTLHLQTESLLLEELGLKDFKPKYKLSYTANLSDAFSVHRVDAEYFQPAYGEIIKKLKGKIELKPLRKFILGIQKGIEVGSDNYAEEGKPFIRVSNLSISGFTDRDQKYISEELYHQLKTTYEPKEGDFLLTKDATPGIAYVVKEPVDGVISSGILKLKINEDEINKEYLALCVSSLIGKMQVERDGGGSVITHWKPEQIKRLKIPILPPESQQKIASLVQQSHEARRKAKELLEEAKQKVEEMIEGKKK